MAQPNDPMTHVGVAYDPDAGMEYLLTRYASGALTVATRPIYSGAVWSPEVTVEMAGVA